MTTTQTHPEHLADRHADRQTWVLVVILVFAYFLVEASSDQFDLARDGHTEWVYPWIWQGSSHLAALIFIPIVPVMLSRFPVSASNWYRTLPAHILASMVFSACHILTMVAIRKIAQSFLSSEPYEFGLFQPEIWLYEYRKDILSYTLLALAFSTGRLLEQRALEARAAREDAHERGRLTLKSGGRTLFIQADDVIRAKAASNYVEVTTPHQTHLARMPLSELERLLHESGTGHIRVHRSYLVHTGHIQEIRPTGDGNVTILLENGAQIPGSRSYRDQLPGMST